MPSLWKEKSDLLHNCDRDNVSNMLRLLFVKHLITYNMHKKSWAWVPKSDMCTICILIKPKKSVKIHIWKKIKMTARYLRINYSAGWKQTRSSLSHFKINNKQNPYTYWYTNILIDKEMLYFVLTISSGHACSETVLQTFNNIYPLLHSFLLYLSFFFLHFHLCIMFQVRLKIVWYRWYIACFISFNK